MQSPLIPSRLTLPFSGSCGIVGLRKWVLRAAACAAFFCFALCSYAFKSAAPFGYALNGTPIGSLAEPGTEAVVLLFVATDCPISNRYLPQIQHLESEFSPKHVVFWFVYPNTTETAAAIRRHEADYGHEPHVLLDPDHRLVNLTHAQVTPEAAILVPGETGFGQFRIVYRGRIDNRYLHFGVQRPHATTHDLEQAIADLLAHRPVHQPDGPPVGCTIIGRFTGGPS